MSKSVFGIATTQGQAERIVQQLQGQGFATSEISVLMPDTAGTRDVGHVKATKAPEGATTGAASGGATGGVIGLLAGIGALAIPGVGAFIAAGPIMAALSGAAVGAATGGVIGGLIGLGIPEIEAKRYEEKLKKGNYLIGQSTFSKLPVLRISALSAKRRQRKRKQITKKGNLWLTKTKWITVLQFHRRRQDKENVPRRTSAKRRKISVRPQAQWPMSIGVVRKRYWMMRCVVSAVSRTTASNTSAKTRRRQSLPRSVSVSCSV